MNIIRMAAGIPEALSWFPFDWILVLTYGVLILILLIVGAGRINWRLTVWLGLGGLAMIAAALVWFTMRGYVNGTLWQPLDDAVRTIDVPAIFWAIFVLTLVAYLNTFVAGAVIITTRGRRAGVASS